MADTMRIYPHREYTYEREFKKLQEWNTSQENRKLIIDFNNHLFAKGCGLLRVSKVSSQLRRIAIVLDMDFSSVSKKDVENLVAYYNREDFYSDETKADYRRCIKQFYKWYKDVDPRLESDDVKQVQLARKLYKYVETGIKSRAKLKSVEFSKIITDENINKVIQFGCKSIKEKAFLKSLHETGCRVGEFLNIRIKDIEILENRALIVVDGKTGERRVPVIHCLPYIVQWLDVHPKKDNFESYIWLSESRRNYHKPLGHRGGQKIIDACFDRAGMEKKKHNFHWFRHSRATLLAPKITQSLLCKYMGWSLDSKQVRRYVHLCTGQLEEAILEMNGIKDRKKKESEKPKKCVCGKVNTSISDYCYKCGKPLNLTTAIRDEEIIQEETDKRLKIFAKVMADPVKRKQFEEFKKMFAGKV